MGGLVAKHYINGVYDKDTFLNVAMMPKTTDNPLPLCLTTTLTQVSRMAGSSVTVTFSCPSVSQVSSSLSNNQVALLVDVKFIRSEGIFKSLSYLFLHI